MKRRLFLFLIISNLFANAYSQKKDCSCETDLKFLDSKIRKTPAYKINKKAYNASYSSALKEVSNVHSMFDCHLLMNKLLISLNDNHSRVYSIDKGANDEIKADSEKFSEFKTSEIFNTYPKPTMDLDSLRIVLKAKTKSDIEGIYNRDNLITIGVYKSNKNNNYKAIILDSQSDIWQVREMMYTLIPFGNDYLLSIGGSMSSKRLIAYTERIENGFFYFMGFQKDSSETNYTINVPSENTYYRDELSDEITYLKIGSFNSWNPTLSEAERFYKSLEGQLTKPNVIIDLRNNSGGGKRNSDILYKILKSYAKENKLYVLINHRTASNAEQFTQRLRKLDNCLVFGSRTNGSLAYEIKDSQYTLPCNKFIAVLTSKKHSDYLEFESQGIEPDITFDFSDDWLSQLKNYILENN
ncbi:MAG: hypothetical protein GYB35_11575 [Algicola sp.]|nr:hypothetical protein [Algicola sp.]